MIGTDQTDVKLALFDGHNRTDNTLASSVWGISPLLDSTMTRRWQVNEGRDSPTAGRQIRDSSSPMASCHLPAQEGHAAVWH